MAILLAIKALVRSSIPVPGGALLKSISGFIAKGDSLSVPPHSVTLLCVNMAVRNAGFYATIVQIYACSNSMLERMDFPHSPREHFVRAFRHDSSHHACAHTSSRIALCFGARHYWPEARGFLSMSSVKPGWSYIISTSGCAATFSQHGPQSAVDSHFP